MADNSTATAPEQQFQYIKLPDGSYGKFRADASDDDIRGAITKDFPDAFKPQPSRAGFTGINPGDEPKPSDVRTIPNPRIRNLPNPVDPSWGPTRALYEGAKTGMSAASIPAATSMSAPALIRAGVGGTVGSALGSKGAEALGAGDVGQEVSGDVGGLIGGGLANIDIPKANIATLPLRYASRMAESAVNQKLVPVKPLLSINTPADTAEAIHIKMPLRDIGLPKPSASEGLPEVQAGAPEATANLKARIATERNLRAQPPFPRVSEGLPEVEEGQPAATGLLHRELSDVAGRPATASTVKPAKVGQLLNDATGAKPLISNVPLKNQLDRVTPVTPKESSVVQSHSYDPAAKELTVKTKNGGEYVHGDVSPEQVQAFEAADSKGKAWNDIRNNSTLVAKVVNGKRVPIKPLGQRIADPNDLTPILQESVQQAKAKK